MINLDRKVEDIFDVLQVLAEQGQGGRASAAQNNNWVLMNNDRQDIYECIINKLLKPIE